MTYRLAVPYTVRLPLCPTTNHAYKLAIHGTHPALVKTAELEAWEVQARLAIGSYEAPRHFPLFVEIVLEVPSKKMRRCDLDGFVKPLLDAVVGRRADQYIDRLEIVKLPGDGWAEVTVAAITEVLA